MPLVKEGDAEGLRQLSSFLSTLVIVSATLVYSKWGIIDKLIELDVLSEDWAPFSDDAFRHYVMYAITSAGIVVRLSRSHVGMTVSYPAGNPDDDEQRGEEWKAEPGHGVSGREMEQALDACLDRPFNYVFNNCYVCASTLLAALRNGAQMMIQVSPAPAIPRAQVQVSTITWLPPGTSLDPRLLVGGIKVRGFNHHNGLETPGFIRSVHGVLRVFAPSATVIKISAGCTHIVFYILGACLEAALAEMCALATSPFVGMHLMRLITANTSEEVHERTPRKATTLTDDRTRSPLGGSNQRASGARGPRTTLAGTPKTPCRRDRLKKVVFEVARRRGNEAMASIAAELKLDMNDSRNFHVRDWEDLAARLGVTL